MVVSGPMLSDSGTLPSPYSSYRYLMIASLSSSCLPEARVQYMNNDVCESCTLTPNHCCCGVTLLLNILM